MNKYKLKNIIFWLLPIILVAGVLFAIQFNRIHRMLESKNSNAANVESQGKLKNNNIDPELLKKPVPQVPILMYHYIRDFNNPSDKLGISLSVSPAKFQEQLNWLTSHNYQTINFDNLVAWRKHQFAIEKKPVIITFDDGFDDGYVNALPVLEANRQIAVFYIVSSWIDQPGRLTRQQILSLDQKGMMIGCHSAHHLNLETGSSNVVEQELSQSKTALEQFLGHPIVHLSYPAGRFGDNTISIEKSLGFQTAVTTMSGISTEKDDLFKLPRLRVTEQTNLDNILTN